LHGMGPTRWLYGAYAMSWPAAKSTVITVESVLEPGCDVVFVTSSSNPDVSVRVGGAKVTIVTVTSLVTRMWRHPP